MLTVNIETILLFCEIILFLIGSGSIIRLYTSNYSKRVFGEQFDISLQRKLLLIGLWASIILIVIFGFFSSFEVIIEGLSDDVVEVYFSATITVSIGFVGIVGVIWSIIYGSLYCTYLSIISRKVEKKEKSEEDEKEIKQLKGEIGMLRKQGKVWLLFLLYFSSVWIIIFILPIMIRLSS